MELGEKLRQARLEAGLSQRALCGEVYTFFTILFVPAFWDGGGLKNGRGFHGKKTASPTLCDEYHGFCAAHPTKHAGQPEMCAICPGFRFTLPTFQHSNSVHGKF